MSCSENENHSCYMSLALKEAEKCALLDEVPAGAVIVRNGEIIAAAGNRRESAPDASAHAEIEAIRQACKKLGGWNLHDCTLYVTLEPCIMCAGAIVNARIKEVVYATGDKKGGAFGGMTDIRKLPVNHRPEVYGGIMEAECTALLQSFFRQKRERGARFIKASQTKEN